MTGMSDEQEANEPHPPAGPPRQARGHEPATGIHSQTHEESLKATFIPSGRMKRRKGGMNLELKE
jgi:hypothetical protein